MTSTEVEKNRVAICLFFILKYCKLDENPRLKLLIDHLALLVGNL